VRTEHNQIRLDAAVRSEWALKAMSRFPFDAVNLSSHDLPAIVSLMSGAQASKNREKYPVLDRLVSSNLRATSNDIATPPAHIIREIRNPARKGGKPIRVALVGVSDVSTPAPFGMQLIDPISAAKEAVSSARRESDLVVVLAHLKGDEALELARKVPGVDVLIDGNDNAFTAPVRIGKTFVAFTMFETRMLGEVRVYQQPNGGFSFKLRYITMDVVVPEDPAVNEMVAAAEVAEQTARQSAAEFLRSWTASWPRLMPKAIRNSGDSIESRPYVSSARCAECHLRQYIVWSRSRHSKSVDAFAGRDRGFETSCIQCHGTGGDSLGNGPANNLKPRNILPEVGCEQCHGPGAVHLKNTTQPYGKVTIGASTCSGCHIPQTSPKFDLKTYWESIKH
jgi:Cytochrome c554 and c-prime